MPEASVVAVTGDPPLSIGAPDESRSDTVTPDAGVPPAPKLASPARPERVLPHWEAVAAEIDTLVVPRVMEVVTFEALVDTPSPSTVNVAGKGVGNGPALAAGHETSAVTLRHNCGASPMALIVALGAEE